jgi:hypothetical protein
MALGHSHKQETPNSGTTQGAEETEYDDRQSMFPFVKKEQSIKRFAEQYTPNSDNQDANNQRGLIKWTAILAGTTGALAVATFVVAFFNWWGSIDTRRLADAARDQADTAIDTEKRQLRAYIGPIFNSFRLTDKVIDCEPSAMPTATFPLATSCYHFKNYGPTPARKPHDCFIVYTGPLLGTLSATKDNILARCAPNPLPTGSTIWPGEVRLGTDENFDQSKTAIMSGNEGYWFGHMTYYDVFGDPHYTDTCRHITHGASGLEFTACRIEGQQED